MDNKPFTATELLKQNEEYQRNSPEAEKVSAAWGKYVDSILGPLIYRIEAILKKHSLM